MERIIVSKDYSYPFIEVKQSFGVFYACSIPAYELLEICQPIRAEVLNDEIDNGLLDVSLQKSKGTQRNLAKTRPEQIRDYIKSGVAAFPNSIIIGANISDRGYLLEDEEKTWVLEGGELKIRKGALSAAVIDGQHRLSGYQLLEKDDPSLQDSLLCSVYLDLPMTYHAQIFSTINSTQRRVHKNLIYQLYQLDMDEKEPKYWSPEVLAVYLSRAIGADESSLLRDRVVLALGNENTIKDWNVSLAALVEGVLRFFSDNPQRDRESFISKHMEMKTRSNLANDSSIWRERYLNLRDRTIYEDLKHYLNECYKYFDDDSAYKSSIGCTALLDALNFLISSKDFDFQLIKEHLNKSLALIDQSKMPKEKITKNKSIFRNVVIVSFLTLIGKDEDFKIFKNRLKDYTNYLNQ